VDMSDEDAARMLATCPQQVVRVGVVEFGERHDTRTNGQTYTPQQTAGRPIRQARGKLNGEVVRHARHPRSILARISCVSARMSRRFYEDATRKLLPWKLTLFNEWEQKNSVCCCVSERSQPVWPSGPTVRHVGGRRPLVVTGRNSL